MPLLNVVLTKNGVPPGDPCDGPYELHNIMGQEDLYRTDPTTGQQTETNTLIGRIIFTTTANSTAVIHYGPVTQGPVNTFEITDAAKYHEAFIDELNPSSLYVFYIEATSESGEIIESPYYYFTTSSEVNVGHVALIWVHDPLTFDKVTIDNELTGELSISYTQVPPVDHEILIVQTESLHSVVTYPVLEPVTEIVIEIV